MRPLIPRDTSENAIISLASKWGRALRQSITPLGDCFYYRIKCQFFVQSVQSRMMVVCKEFEQFYPFLWLKLLSQLDSLESACQ